MTTKTSHTCSRCGKKHEEWPALAFQSPHSYDVLTEEEKQAMGELSEDFCIIRHPDQTDRFIRGTLTQQVVDSCQDLEYGLWVSLSEKSFQDYQDNFDNENHETSYFGWLNSTIPQYDFSESIPTNVWTRTGHLRPEIVPHRDFDHPFVKDYYAGITKKEAEKRISSMLKNIDQHAQPLKKRRWKF